MGRSYRVAVVVAAIAAGSAIVAGSARASLGVVPPRNIPDLSQMALRVSDLPPGARVKKQGYVKTSSVAEYDRAFEEGTARVHGKRLLSLENDISLETSAGVAFFEFAAARRLLVSKNGRKRIADEIRKEFDSAADFVRVSSPFRFAGQDSVALTVSIGTFLGTVQAEFGFFRVDRVLGVLTFAGSFDTKLTRGDMATLARPVTAHIRAGLVPISVTPPTVTGLAAAGQTLTASTGLWKNGSSSFAYRWQRCDAAGSGCTDIAGATAQTYLLLDADEGSTVRVEVTATNASGSTTVASPPTAPVVPSPGPPVNVALPSISGTAAQGQTLAATVGTWVGKPTAFAYQWQRCDAAGANCVAIDGANAATYEVAVPDAGSTLRVAVTATNASGSTPAVSQQTATIG